VADAGVKRYRDWLATLLPWWLSDRRLSSGKWTGYRFLWSIVAYLDALIEAGLQALKAPWPGVGTPTALPFIARSRGILRGQADTDASFASKLTRWLDKWRRAGSQYQLAVELHEYLGNAPVVRVINRAGHWVTINADGSSTVSDATWNWDSLSNPERAGFWSELFIVIYPTQWALQGNYGAVTAWGSTSFGLGHLVSRQEWDAVHAIVAQWKGAHSKVRAIIWTSDATLFDPAVPASCPDGTWGEYGGFNLTGSRVASGRNTTTCRYWEL
jgi:hypothetical protein